MAISIREPPCWYFQTEQSKIASRQDRGDDGGREPPFPHPPEQVEAVHHALNAGDVIREVERDVASEVSIRGHEN
jgi:hypothetical protein